MKTALREIRGIGLTTTELTPADMDHMADDEEMARPERFKLPTNPIDTRAETSSTVPERYGSKLGS